MRKSLERGEIVCVNFDPQVGKEMDFERPAIVISPAVFNFNSNLIIVCPITSSIKGSPWEVLLPKGMKTQGAIRVDHIKTIDKDRCKKHQHRVVIFEKTPDLIIDEVLAKLETLVCRAEVLQV